MDKAALMVAQSQSFVEGQRVWVPVTAGFERLERRAPVTVPVRLSSEWASGVIVGVSRGADEQVTLSVSLGDTPEDTIYVPAMQCFLQNEVSDPDDLTRSDYLHEPGIIHALRTRFHRDTIYTASGQVLIALNPNKPLPHLYTPRMIAEYKAAGLDSLKDLAPHCYAIAENAYQMMMMDDPARQVILISGESGAGKTFTARLVMSYLAERNGKTGALPIEQQILESNPLLEAFGNAKTARNDNSSRFGKFTEMHFDEQGRVCGAHIETYLLERSRVTSIASGERGFHIFYQLLSSASAEMRERLLLPPDGGVSQFAYLARGTTANLAFGKCDAEAFEETLNAMRIVGLDDEHIEAVLGVVAAVLHLGNVRFAPAEHAAADEAVLCSDEASSVALANAAFLLGTSPDELRRALMCRSISAGGDVIRKHLSELECYESRDSLARGLYSKLFAYVVSSVNERIGRMSGGSGRGRTPPPKPRTIGILDIYGFESFETNSLEQLCINLANETLQQSFNEHVFKEEQKIYIDEGIDWRHVDFHDNLDVIELMGQVFGILDEACRLGPRVTNDDLAVTMRSKLDGHPRFSAPKRDPTTFCINHYAGEVRYDTSADMLERNRDRTAEQHQHLMRASTRWLPRTLYEGDVEVSHRSAKLATICSIFLKQLDKLSSKLDKADRHYIRCIKPAAASLAGSLEPAYVLDQLRAGGVLEGVRIACQGWPTKLNYLACARRYICLLVKEDIVRLGILLSSGGSVDWPSLSMEQEAAIVAAILSQSGLEGWQMGRTQLFLRGGHLAQLEGMRARVMAELVVRIQSHWRAYAARTRYNEIMRKQSAATLIQSMWRAHVVRDRYVAARQSRREAAAAVLIQTIWRMSVAKRAFVAQCSFLEDLARHEATALEVAALQAESEALRLAALAAEEAGRAAIASENEELKAEVAALKSLVADLECRLAESLSASMATTEETKAAAMALHEKLEELNLRHADEVSFLRESLATFNSKEKEYALVLSTKDGKISHLAGQLEASAARLDQLSLELRERDNLHAVVLQRERNATSKARERISQLESLLATEKDAWAESNANVQTLRNEKTVMSSRLDSLLQQLERAEVEIAQLRQRHHAGAADLSTEEDTTHLSFARSSLDDIERPLSSEEACCLDQDKERIVELVVHHLICAPTVCLNELAKLNLNSWRLRNVFCHMIDDPSWSTQEVLLSVDKIAMEIGREAAASFSTCCGLVDMVIETSAMVKLDIHGRPPMQRDVCVQIGDKLLDIPSLWESLATFVTAKVPIDVGSLLREDATKTARLRGSKTLLHEALTFEERFSRCFGSCAGAWLKLIANVDTLMYLLDSMPPTTAKVVVICTLGYLDARFLNFLLTRRDCSVSSARALLTALTIVESYVASCKLSISIDEFRGAMQRTLTAALFISDWWDDAVRQARSGMVGESSALAKCSALSHLQLGQIIEARYDDFMPSYGPDTEKSILLAALKSMAVSSLSRSVSEGEAALMTTPGDDEILVDCDAEFCLGGGRASRSAKKLACEASTALFSHGEGLAHIDACCSTVRGQLPTELEVFACASFVKF